MAAGVTRNTDFRCALCTGDYGLDLCLLGLGHGELVKGLLKIIEKGLPLGALKNGKLYLAVMGRRGDCRTGAASGPDTEIFR